MNIDLNTIANMLSAAEGLVPKRVPCAPTSPNYPIFLENTRASDEELDFERRFFESNLTELPLVSIMLDAVGGSETDINSTLISLVAQTYGNWELIIGVDLAYPDADKYGGSMNIKLIMCADNEMKWMQEELRGEYVMMLRPGDRLSPDALFKMTMEMRGRALVYADNDICDKNENRKTPRFKPAYSPVSEICFGTVGRPLMVTEELHGRVGGLDGPDEISYRVYVQKCLEIAKDAAHISKVLLSEKYDGPVFCGKAPGLETGLTVSSGSFYGCGRIVSSRALKMTADIIIGCPTSVKQLRRCLEAIDAVSAEKVRRIIISVCGKPDNDLARYLALLKKYKAANVVIDSKRPCTIPSAFNLGASYSFADCLIFVSPDVEVITPEFVEELMITLQIGGVSVGGGKLVDENDFLLHTGTVIGINGWACSLYTGHADDIADETKCIFTSMQREVSAVCGTFMAVKAEDFCRIGMFDETFEDVGWDTEFCIRASEKSMKTVFTPYAKARYHGKLPSFEEASHDQQVRCYDVFRSVLLEGDPYYSTNYDYRRDVPQIAIEPSKPIELNPLY